MSTAAAVLPHLPTRQEVVDYANAQAPNRPHPITMKTIRRWDSQGWIKRHPEGGNPVRYITKNVEDFLAGRNL